MFLLKSLADHEMGPQGLQGFMIRMTMCVSFHLRPWKNKYSSYPAWRQGLMKLFPYGLLVGQHPPENYSSYRVKNKAPYNNT